MSKLRVALLYGGRSTEHEISILSARNILAALDRDKFDPILIGIDKLGRWLLQDETTLLGAPKEPRNIKLVESETTIVIEPRPNGCRSMPDNRPMNIDVVFPVLHGPMGEDGTLQGLLELAELPFVGSGVLGSSVSMDKDTTKRLLRDAKIPISDFVTLEHHQYKRAPKEALRKSGKLGFPRYVKPANQGSSVGVSRVNDEQGLAKAVENAFQYDTKILIEEAIHGREIECSVLGNEDPIASVIGEVIVQNTDGFYSYEAKYVDSHGAKLAIPAKLKSGQQAEIQEMAIRTFRALNCSGLSRVDFFLEKSGRLLVNEINTIPGFTNISMYPMLWAESGLHQKDLITKLLNLAIDRYEKQAKIRRSVH
ncbi:MAG: D-alanine--D-alanine ligase [Myxococcota bacterium]|nr:D-alanine--D-alanine ligase [Myxococcota bacterium]